MARDRDVERPAPGLDPEGLPKLLDRLYRAAWAMCGSPHDAEDLVQETLARALARHPPLRCSDPLPYLMRALRNTYLTGLRTAGRRPRITELPADESSTMESLRSRPELALEQRAALDAIAALPDDFRSALVAVDVAGLSYAEAGRALRTREATIASRVFRARRQVANALSDDRAPSVPGSLGQRRGEADAGLDPARKVGRL